MTDPPGDLAAALADRYRLDHEIGTGGMATVYLAEDLKHHRQVANGTPLGPLGVDPSHVTVESLGTTELRVPAMQPSPTG